MSNFNKICAKFVFYELKMSYLKGQELYPKKSFYVLLTLFLKLTLVYSHMNFSTDLNLYNHYHHQHIDIPSPRLKLPE
jgi:hypothetical protein